VNWSSTCLRSSLRCYTGSSCVSRYHHKENRLALLQCCVVVPVPQRRMSRLGLNGHSMVHRFTFAQGHRLQPYAARRDSLKDARSLSSTQKLPVEILWNFNRDGCCGTKPTFRSISRNIADQNFRRCRITQGKKLIARLFLEEAMPDGCCIQHPEWEDRQATRYTHPTGTFITQSHVTCPLRRTCAFQMAFCMA
jgi:hypothetical protein